MCFVCAIGQRDGCVVVFAFSLVGGVAFFVKLVAHILSVAVVGSFLFMICRFRRLAGVM